MKKILIAAALGISVPAISQTSFLGIAFDSPFPGEMKECPKSKILNMVDHELVKGAGTCYFIKQHGTYQVYNSPDLGLGHMLTVETSDDKPIIFSFSFNKTKYDQAIDIFTARYGRPQKTNSEKVQTRAGEYFNSRANIWEGKILRIQLDEIGKDVRWSDAVIVNLSAMNSINKKNREAAEAAARKL
ncbi:hypothetical protein AB4Z46_30740 [Variovorax sp. M-6]|uniref:hypothetical protein n=1 Tax=Variovorax sp. M-6 TaxID=3233041 RepID=UPI003F9DF6FA